MSDPSQLRIQCPECDAEILVDVATGTVITHRVPRKAPAGGKTLDGLLAGLEGERERRESVFEREKAAVADRERLLEEKFAAALRRAEEEDDDSPPVRPFDLD